MKNRAAEILRRLSRGACGKRADAQTVRDAEKALRVSFPEDFKAFLSAVGWCSVGHLEFFGLGRDVPPHLDLVRVTEMERRTRHPSLRADLIPLMNDGAGNLPSLATAESNGESCPVVFWSHDDPNGENQEPMRIAPDYLTWLSRMLDDLRAE
ncbi:MAG TPA: SMI1/KNR4 family protein [Phycisphaerae bacterium]|nr:SMI1/KNR4 family protein [Phycisphaerae bacterium]